MYLRILHIPRFICAAILLAALLYTPQTALGQWEVQFGGDNEPDNAHKVIGGQYGSLLGWSFTIGGTHASNAASAFNSNPPNVLITYTDPLGSVWRGIMHDVEAWDVDASMLELNDGSGIAWTTGIRNPDNGSFDIVVARAPYGGAPTVARVFGGFQDDGGTSIIQLPDNATYGNDLLIAGTTESFGNGTKNGFLLKVDEVTLAMDWLYIYSGPSGSDRADEFYAVRPGAFNFTNPDFVYAVGTSNSFNGTSNYDMWVVRVDPQNGAPIFHNAASFGGVENDRAFNLETTSFGPCGGPLTDRVNLVGETYSGTFYANDICVLAMDDLLVKQWANRYDVLQNPVPSAETAYDVAQRSNTGTIISGDLILVGQTNHGGAAYGEALGMMISSAGTPIVFQNMYGDQLTYSTARSIGFNYNLLLPYYVAGRTDAAQAGDQYLFNMQPGGQTGQNGGNPCPIAITPLDHSMADPVTPTSIQVTSVTPIFNSSITIQTTEIGQQIDICGP